MERILAAAAIASCLACGQGSDFSPGAGRIVDPSIGAVAVESLAELPECNSDRLGLLVYVRATDKFESCEASGWQVVGTTGLQGNRIGAQYRYRVANWAEAVLLCADCPASLTNDSITNVRVTVFTDASAFVSLLLSSGQGMSYFVAAGITTHRSEWTLGPPSPPYVRILRVELTPATIPPVLKANIDSNGPSIDDLYAPLPLVAYSGSET